MSMSRKHYKMVANAISETKGELLISKRVLVNKLITAFELDNSNFDYEIFEEACK
jgi:hypothetical protein